MLTQWDGDPSSKNIQSSLFYTFNCQENLIVQVMAILPTIYLQTLIVEKEWTGGTMQCQTC